jgi:hypothetical protein
MELVKISKVKVIGKGGGTARMEKRRKCGNLVRI